MIKYKLVGLLILLIVLGCETTSDKPYAIVIDASMLTDKLSKREGRMLEGFISAALDTITSRMDYEFRDTLFAFVFDDRPEEIGLNRIYVSREYSTDPDAILFLVTRAIAPFESTGMYLQGLAMMMPLMNQPPSVRDNYRRKKLGDDPGKFVPIKLVLNDDSAFVAQQQLNNNLIDYEAGIFLAYLVTEYGWEKLQELYKSRTKDFQAVYLKSLDQLEEQWIESFFPTSSKDTLTIRFDQ